MRKLRELLRRLDNWYKYQRPLLSRRAHMRELQQQREALHRSFEAQMDLQAKMLNEYLRQHITAKVLLDTGSPRLCIQSFIDAKVLEFTPNEAFKKDAFRYLSEQIMYEIRRQIESIDIGTAISYAKRVKSEHARCACRPTFGC